MRFSTALKGLIIGGTMLAPGVSGGSMAMILGIYDRLILAVNALPRRDRSALSFLAAFLAGAAAGMLLFARPLLLAIAAHPRPVMYLFLGAIAGAVPTILRQARLRSFGVREAAYLLTGLAIVLAIALLPADLLQAGTLSPALRAPLLAAAGFLAAIALILPGVSVSYFLLALGLYEETIRAISALDMVFLLPLGVGLLAGIPATTGVLERAMARRPQATFLIILGFVAGSISEAFPGVPVGWEWPVCIAAALGGFGAIRLMTKLEEGSLCLVRRGS